MQFVITFLEGLISFISPCMLPMLPLYLSYFAGDGGKGRSFPRILSFILGFTVVFCIMGFFAGSIGSVLVRYNKLVNIVSGLAVILFGLGFLEIIHLPFFRGMKRGVEVKSSVSAFAFGIVFAVSLSPCTGAFLGSAFMMASSSGTVVKGVLMLFCYSMGLGVPFAISAFLMDRLGGLFSSIKKNYRVINTVCGIFLILVGVAMMFGLMNRMVSIMM